MFKKTAFYPLILVQNGLAYGDVNKKVYPVPCKQILNMIRTRRLVCLETFSVWLFICQI